MKNICHHTLLLNSVHFEPVRYKLSDVSKLEPEVTKYCSLIKPQIIQFKKEKCMIFLPPVTLSISNSILGLSVLA